jgi:hypothetical protein
MTAVTYKTANEAIRHSRQYDEISRCEDTPENHEALRRECDDHCSGNGLMDYWANDPDSDHKMLWRVNVTVPDRPQVYCGWYGIRPEGSAWVAIRIDLKGKMGDLIEESEVDTLVRSKDRRAWVAEAMVNGALEEIMPGPEAEAVVATYDPTIDAACCVVQKIN